MQGVTADRHVDVVKRVLEIEYPQRVILSVAYLNWGGLSLLHDALKPVADKTTVFAGIRNGITTAQALSQCLAIGCDTYVVDTGSRSIVFHPKVYMSRNAREARIVVGSANLTIGGLNSNVEASLFFELELTDPATSAMIAELEGKIEGMITDYEHNVFQVTSDTTISDLLNEGRLIDERVILGPTGSGFLEKQHR